MKEGYIRFNCRWENSAFDFNDVAFHNINSRRTWLHNHNLIGAYPDGIGYGNISMRYQDKFLISASQTGSQKFLGKESYSLVTAYDLSNNSLDCRGITKASSESLSHAAIYHSLPDINAVIHVHAKPIWDKWCNVLPTTSPDAEYGTPEMAFEIFRLLKNPENVSKRVIIMGGHIDGIITFHKTIWEAFEKIRDLFFRLGINYKKLIDL